VAVENSIKMLEGDLQLSGGLLLGPAPGREPPLYLGAFRLTRHNESEARESRER